MSMPIVSLVCLALLTLSGCSKEVDVPSSKIKAVDPANALTQAEKNSQQGAQRIVTIERDPDAPALNNIEPLPVAAAKPLDPIVRTEAPDGSVTLDVGNRFMRPLMVSIDCDGQMKQSHHQTLTAAPDCDAKDGDE